LKKKEDKSLVHWWYYPDSYDNWLPNSDVVGETEPDQEHQGVWYVTPRWLKDSDIFNE